MSVPHERLRILIVDDEQPLLELTKAFLEMDGRFEVIAVHSAADALTALAAERFDTVVSDYQMPGMNGIELLRRIRVELPSIPFILFTGKGREEIMIQALELGADFYLQKGGEPRSQFAEMAHQILQACRRKKAEDKLRQSEERFRGIAERSSDLMLLVDQRLWVRYASPSIKRITGYDPEEVVGKNPLSIGIIKEDYERMMEAVSAGTTDVRDPPSRIRIHRKGGGIAVLDVAATPIFEGKNIEGYQIQARDVTENSMLEDRLRINEQRLRNAQKIGHMGSWSVDLEKGSGYIWGSDEGFAIFGIHLPSGEVPINRIEDCIIERERVHQALVDLIECGEEYNLEYVIRPEDGSPQRIVSSLASLENRDGRPVKIDGVVQDITERRQSEERLRWVEQNARLLAENIKDVVWILDMQTLYFRYVSPSIVRLRGYTPEEMMEHPIDWHLMPYASDALVQLARDRVGVFLEGRDRGIFYTDEIEQPCKDGSTVWTEIITKLFRNPETGHVEMHGVSREITQWKNAREALAAANRKLSILSGITRHDILNQLTSLSGYLELERRETSKERREEYVRKMTAALATIRKQITFTKDYENMGEQAPYWQPVGPVLAEAASQRDPGRVQIVSGLGGLEVMADPLLIKVFYNLIDNSLRHGERVTRITVDCELRGEDMVIVYEDNGTGIGEAQKCTLFQRGAGRNSGLGLFLTREILAITGMTIAEKGRPGEGARFEIVVPRKMFRTRKSDSEGSYQPELDPEFSG